MTLKEAIKQVQNEYDSEVRSVGKHPETEAAARALLTAEMEQVLESDVVNTILQGRRIFPPDAHELVVARLIMALRLGMRVQRKLDAPEKTTTLFDSPCVEKVK